MVDKESCYKDKINIDTKSNSYGLKFEKGLFWLSNSSHEELKVFIKEFLKTGRRNPFPDLPGDERLNYQSFVEFIHDICNPMIEERAKKILSELLLESREEFSNLKNRNLAYVYIYNLVGASAHIQSYYQHKENNFLYNPLYIIYTYAYEANFKDCCVYGENLHKFLLKCLFGMNIPPNLEENILELCEENVYVPICSSLCFRKLFEIKHENALVYLIPYLETVEKIDKSYSKDVLIRLFNKPWIISILRKNEYIIINEIMNQILVLGWREDMETIGLQFRLNGMSIDDYIYVYYNMESISKTSPIVKDIDLYLKEKKIFSVNNIDEVLSNKLQNYCKKEAGKIVENNPTTDLKRYNIRYGNTITS